MANVGKLHALLNQYDMVVGHWARVNQEAEDEGTAPSVKDCELYSDGLESMAHAFAAAIRDEFGED